MSRETSILSGLSAEERRQLLRELVAQRSQDVEGEYPVTHGQRALWFLQSRAPESVAYNIMLAARIRESVDLGALRTALRDLVARHAILRTTYRLQGGTLTQVVARAADPALTHVDAADLDEDPLRARIEADAHQPFLLSTGPVMRVSLYTRAPEDHVLLLCIHHIAIDGWSMDVLMQELRALYLAHASGQPIPAELSQPGTSYAEYAAWEQEFLSSPAGVQMKDYWQRTLPAEIPALTIAPTCLPGTPAPRRERPRPEIQTFVGAESVSLLDPELARAARRFARESRVTLYSLFLTGLAALLHRYSGQDDLCIGSFVARRPRHEFESAIGYYLNTLPIHVQTREQPSFRALLAQVSQRVVDGLENKDYPFSLLIEQLKPQRDVSRSPLFDVAFNWLSTGQFDALTSFFMSGQGSDAAPRAERPALHLDPYPLRRSFARFDLEIAMCDCSAGLALYVQYNTAIHDEQTVVRLAAHLQALVRAALQNPDTPIHALAYLEPAERAQIVVGWNQTQAPYAAQTCLHQFFEAQAARTPDAIAASTFSASGTQSLSYRALDERAERIAQALRRRGAGAETLVAVCAERSLDLLAALLGVLKSGAGYVPIDPAYPDERVRFMVKDSGAALILTTAATDALTRALPAPRLRIEDALTEGRADAEPPAAADPARPDSPAYLIYTSGSTGQPKGVLVEHRSCAALLGWADASFPKEDFAFTLASTSVCFDVSVFELFFPLSLGGRLVLVDNALHLRDVPPQLPITAIVTVPSAIGALVDLDGFPRSVRAAYLAGEPLRRSVVRKIHEKTAIERTYNIYGPTENTVYATWTQVPPGGEDEPTIGRPIHNCRAYVLDAQLQPVPVLHIGELYLGGDSLARGYHQRPELDAQRFVRSPLRERPDERLYRTGDLARFLPDGQIEFLGRRDTQIKLNGFRIELGEIEVALTRHGAVGEAAVVVDAQPAGSRLVGYCALRGCVPADAAAIRAELRAHLSRTLPSYMVPGVLVVLPELPHTPSGKIDRGRLPRVTDADAESAPVTTERRTPTETIVTEIWAALLGREVAAIPLRRNFFELGGHSMLIAQMAQQLAARCQRTVLVADLFRLRDVAGIAAWIDADAQGTTGAGSTDTAVDASERARDRRQQLAAMLRSRQARKSGPS